jgi:asparagine synthase (glutamine-hydrolysing)
VCGIAGIVHLDGAPASRPILQRMTDAIAHRGPDSEGHWLEGPVGLGHRRLSIIDLSPAGHQPMASPDGRFLLTYNGEVYNFRELRTELEATGWQFRSRGDSEVVLAALAHWGTAAVTRFNGMFAFAFHDRSTGELFLCRDRYGVKPLYYSVTPQRTFLFGSEVKALLAHPECPRRVDVEGLTEYLTFQNFFTERTLFDCVRMLPAGCSLLIRRDRAEVPEPARYWDYSFQEPSAPSTEEKYIDELDGLFDQAVRRQLVSDVDVGAYLSGGMDSGSITAVAARQLPHMRTFTCGFDLSSASGVELNFDERPTAERMSYLFKTEHYEMVLKAGDMERVMSRVVWHLEEPRVGQSYPNFYAAQLASRFVRVVLSGTGGDELFGGYPWRYYRGVVNDDFAHYVEKYFGSWQRLIPTSLMPKILAPIWGQVSHISTRDIFKNVFASHASTLTRPEDYIQHSLYFEAKTFLHGLLVVEDKLSMAHSLESRVPFLDNDLVDSAMRVPARLKVNKLAEVVRLNENDPGAKSARYFQKTADGKLLLRRMMARHIPAEVAEREKQGFSAPDGSWFKGESIEYVRNTIRRPNAKLYEYFDYATTCRLIDDHLEGRENRRLLIWSLLYLETWLAQFMSPAQEMS